MPKKNQAKIFSREINELVSVLITGDVKPYIPQKIVRKWQSLLDVISKDFNLPSGLITQLKKNEIEVFATNSSKNNPYKKGESEKLAYGLYCKNVIETQQKLLIPDATKNNIWKDNNPNIDLNMISYLGYPINWPDGEVFGAICLLDSKENFYSERCQKILSLARQFVETDLVFLMNYDEIKQLKNEINKIIQSKLKYTVADKNGKLIKLDKKFKKIILELKQHIPSHEV